MKLSEIREIILFREAIMAVKYQRKMAIVLFFLLIFFYAPAMSADISVEKKQIIKVVNQFFEVLASRDVNVAKQIVIPEGCSFSIREQNGVKVVKSSNFQGFLDNLPNPKAKYKEVMEDPKILLHRGIAVLWAKYRFFINDKFSHCGVDAFSLMKTDKGWKIASIIYTVEKKGCN